MKFPPYERYKPSGLEWMQDVPDHWEVNKISYGFRKLGSGTTPKSDSSEYYDGDVPWVTTSELRETVITDTRQKVTNEALKDYPTLRLYPVGTILFAMYGATIGRLGILGIPATVNQACCAMAWPTRFDAMFIYYWLWMRRPILVSLSSGGGQPNLSQDDLREIRIPTPPIAEQRCIAAFLDRETGRIDRLVAKKRELIERLKEKRTALISRAVTRGLPPAAARAAGLPVNPPLKPSGIDWLGDIPEHWEVKPLKFIALVKTGFAFSSDDFTDDGVPVLRIGDITRDGKIDFSSAKYLPEEFLSSHRSVVVQQCDISMAMTGATIGKVGRYTFEAPALLNQRVCIFRPKQNCSHNFLWYLLNSDFYIEHVLLKAFGGAQPNISDTQLLSCSVPVPIVKEQAAIAAYLDTENAKLDALMAKVEEAIERLQEYRTALITSAVTGKIDVREEVAS